MAAKKVVDILKEAITKIEQSEANSSTKTSHPAASERPTASTIATTSTIQDTMTRVRDLLRASSSSGLCRRLKSAERLRATASKQTKDKPKKSAEKALEFALLRCFDDEDDDSRHLKWNSVIASGMLLLAEDDNEGEIRRKIVESLLEKYPQLGENNFDFVKVRHKEICNLNMGPGTQYNYPVIKKMAGQGLLYLQVKDAYRYVYDPEGVEEDEAAFEKSVFELEESLKDKPKNSGEKRTFEEVEEEEVEVQEISAPKKPKSGGVPLTGAQIPQKEPTPWDPLVNTIFEQGLTDPIEILRFLQKELVKGRVVDAVSEADSHEGVTNSICVDRHNILTTTFSELAEVECCSLTFEVDFMGEKARDLGGPRKEWIRLVNNAIKEKYFDNGLRKHLADDYYYVGIMVAVALLQNGQLPTYMPADIIDQLSTPSTNKCIANIQRGLNTCGLSDIIGCFPVLLHLLRPSNARLTPKILLHLLQPEFSEEGSSANLREKELYALFVKYVREVGSGRRSPVTLESILIFVTGASEEPVLGFSISPAIRFPKNDEEQESPYQYIPTAQTCTNVLQLPIGSLQSKLPSSSSLFDVYDIAFANTHFGTV